MPVLIVCASHAATNPGRYFIAHNNCPQELQTIFLCFFCRCQSRRNSRCAWVIYCFSVYIVYLSCMSSCAVNQCSATRSGRTAQRQMCIPSVDIIGRGFNKDLRNICLVTSNQRGIPIDKRPLCMIEGVLT